MGKRKLEKKGKRRKKYKRRRKVLNHVTDIEEEEDNKEEEEEKSNIPLSNYETKCIQKPDDKEHNVAPPPIDYAVDTSSTTQSISEESEHNELQILHSLDNNPSMNSSVRIIRRNNSNKYSYKELSRSTSDNLPLSPIERMGIDRDDKSEKNNDSHLNYSDIVTPQFPMQQPIAIPVVSSSDEQQNEEESMDRNTQIIRNDKSRKERSNSFGPGMDSILLYGEEHGQTRYEEEGSSFLEHSYDGVSKYHKNDYSPDRTIKLSRRRAINNKKISKKLKNKQYHYSDREYSINSEFESIENLIKLKNEYKKMHKMSLCDDSSLSISHESDSDKFVESEKENKNELKLKKVSKSEKKQKNKKYAKTKSRKSLQITLSKKVQNEIYGSKKHKKKKQQKRLHSQSVDIPKSKYQKNESNDEQITKAIKSKKRKRAQSVKYKKKRAQIKDIDVCKNKVKNSIFRREKGHKKSFEDHSEDSHRAKSKLSESEQNKLFNSSQRKHSKSVTSYSYDSLLKEANNDDMKALNHWMNQDEEKKDHSMTHSVTTTFKKIEEKLKDGLIEPGSTQYFEELDNAMTKLKEKHQKLANKAHKKKESKSPKRQRSASQKKAKRQVMRSKSVYFNKKNDDDDTSQNRKRSKHKKSKTVDRSLSVRKKSKNKKKINESKKRKKQKDELLDLSLLHKSKSLNKTVKKSKNNKKGKGSKDKMSNHRRQKSAKVLSSKSKKKRMKKKCEYVMDSEDEEDIDLDEKHKKLNKMNQKRKRIKIQNEENKKKHPFHLNSSRREGQQFKQRNNKKNSHSLSKLYDEEIRSNSSFHEQRMELI